MIHEQHTITGELEITDSRTMKVIARKLTLTAARPASLGGKRYEPGERIECIFTADDDLSLGTGTGPWTPGGYSAPWLKHYATEIRDIERVKKPEKHAPSGEELKAVKLILTATKATALNWKRYGAGARIEVTLPSYAILEDGNGPWYPGGYSAAWLKMYAVEITHIKRQHERHPEHCLCPACKPREKKPWRDKVDIHFFVSPALKIQVVKVARERNIDLCDIAREALEEWLQKHTEQH